jgi:hypothetical protein
MNQIEPLYSEWWGNARLMATIHNAGFNCKKFVDIVDCLPWKVDAVQIPGRHGSDFFKQLIKAEQQVGKIIVPD